MPPAAQLTRKRSARPKAQPRGQPREAAPPTLALCMIVRNEAHNLRDCLEPLGGCFDEVVVVDTGSTDGTIELARELGARVIERPWDDDFAAARNASIDATNADWILWLDADDRVGPTGASSLRKLIDPKKNTAYYLRLVSPERPGAAVDSAAPAGTFACQQLRLFPKLDGARFAGRVHERIADSLRRLHVEFKTADVTIEHVGHADPVKLRRSVERNHRLLELELADRPDDIPALFYLGRSCADGGNLDRAIATLKHLVYETDSRELEPAIFQYAFVNLAEIVEASGDLADARAKYDEIIALFPDFSLALLERGECLVALYDRHPSETLLAGAQADLTKALELGIDIGPFALNVDGLKSSIHIGLGQCHQRRGEPQAAEGCFRKAVEECPSNVVARLLLGNVLDELGRAEDAEGCYVECVERSAGFFEAQYNLANCLERAGRMDEAAAAFARAAGIRPSSPDAHLRLGNIHFRRGEHAQAARCFRRAAEADPAAGDPLANYALAQLALGRHWQAMQAAEIGRLLPDIPDDLRQHFELLGNEARRRDDGQALSLSLCVLTRGEADGLAACVEPVASLVDEVIVVDTAADPAAKQFCERVGARWLPLEWCDDFSAARNEAIAQASGDWLLWLDTDEHIGPREMQAVRKLMDGDLAAYRVTIGAEGAEARQVRLMPNLPGVRFRGTVAEQVEQSLRERMVPVLDSDVHVLHAAPADGGARHRELIVRLLRERAAADPADGYTIARLAAELCADGEIEQALDACVEMLSLAPLTDPARLAVLGQLSRCVERLSPGTLPAPRVRVLLGEWYCSIGRIDEARWVLDDVSKPLDGSTVDPADVRLAHYWLGRCHQARDGTEDAISQFEQVEGDPALEAEAAYMSGRAYGAAGQFDRAAALYAKAVGLAPQMAAAHASLGDLAARAKNSEAAERHYRDALAADAHHSAAHLNLGSLLFNAGRVEAAERHFRVAARLEPRSPASLNNLGNVRFAQQKFEEAYRLFQRARDLDPSNATIYRNLGAVQLKLGLHEESLDSYSTCFQLAPDLSDVLLDLAEVHYARRDFGRALEMSEEFVRRAPHCGRGFAKMGRCYEAMNQPLAALASYECAARIDPSFRLPAERISRLRETLELREAPDSKK